MAAWIDTTLGELIALQRGFDLPERKRRPGPYKVLSSGGVSGWHDEGPAKGPGLVIGRATNLGVPTWSDEDFWPLNTTLFVKDFHGNDPRFVYYLLRQLDLSGYNSGSVQPMLNRNYVANVRLRVPRPDEQREISRTLRALDDKIESNCKLAKMLESETQLVFASLFDVQRHSIGVAISELIDVNPLRRLRRGDTATYIGMADLPEHSALIESWGRKEFSSGQRFTNGDVLMARITPCLENGKTAIVDMLDEGSVGWGSTEFIVLSARPPLTTPWVYCLARSEPVHSFAVRSMTGTSGRQRFPATAFEKYLVEQPYEYAVAEFNELAIPSFQKMTQLRDENVKLRALRDALAPELLSSRLHVPEAREAAEIAI